MEWSIPEPEKMAMVYFSIPEVWSPIIRPCQFSEWSVECTGSGIIPHLHQPPCGMIQPHTARVIYPFKMIHHGLLLGPGFGLAKQPEKQQLVHMLLSGHAASLVAIISDRMNLAIFMFFRAASG